jgi:hypothetical protein
LDVLAPQHLNGFGDALFFMRSDEQMDMVGHQHVGVAVAAVCGACLLELFEVELVVGLSTENFGAVVATQYDVLRLAGYDESGQARHDPLSCVDEWTLYGRFTKS